MGIRLSRPGAVEVRAAAALTSEFVVSETVDVTQAKCGILYLDYVQGADVAAVARFYVEVNSSDLLDAPFYSLPLRNSVLSEASAGYVTSMDRDIIALPARTIGLAFPLAFAGKKKVRFWFDGTTVTPGTLAASLALDLG